MLPLDSGAGPTPRRADARWHAFLLRLVARVVAANLFLCCLVGWVLYQSRQQYESQAIATTQNLAQSLETNVSGVLDKAAIAIAAVAIEVERQLASGGLRPDAIDAYIRRQQAALPELDGIRVNDAAGDARFGVIRPSGPATNIADREYFQRLRGTPPATTIVSEPVLSRQSGKWVIVVARATYGADGHFAGIVSGTLAIDYFTRLFAPIDVGPKGVIAIRTAQLALVARKPETPIPGGYVGTRSISSGAVAILAEHPDNGNYSAAAAVDGIERRIAYRRTPRWALTIFVGEATSDYLARWYKEVATLWSMAAIFLLASIWSAAVSLRTRRSEMAALEELRSSKEQVERSETRFRTLYDSTMDAVTLLGMDGFFDCNQAALDLFGIPSREALRSSAPGMALSPPTQPCGTDSRVLAKMKISEAFEKGSARFEWIHRRVDTGELFPTEVQLTRMTLDGTPVLQGVTRDITQRRKADEQIRYLAYFDALTRLPNRRLLMDRLAQAILAGQRTRQFGVLMILDLDNFKSLNDTCGHDVGDSLLVEVAKRIVASVREEDTVARLGGDEYVILAENLGMDEAQAAGHAEQIAAKIGRMIGLPGLVAANGAHRSTASIGLTLFRGADASIDALFKQADLALYQAKGAGRNTVRFFNPEMQLAIDSRTAMEAALHEALRLNEFALYYQPQYDGAGRLTGAEALLRWLPPGRGPVSPAEFIPLAEETGFIIPLGRWVMQTACAQLSAWADHPATRDLTIAVNVSPRQFREADFTDQVRACIQASGADPSRLKLELTESVVLKDVDEVIERMNGLRKLGLTFSLDDFGTGFSSLSYLKRLPLDQVKIDQSFVRDVVSDANDGAIVRAIVAMSRSLGIEVIAEGVETREQLDFLTACGCDHFQGYLFGKPAPIADWRGLLLQPAPVAL